MPLIVTSNQVIRIDGRLAATVSDCAPFANLPMFACCLSPANPLFVGGVVSMALGGAPAAPPCTPIPTGPWSPPSLISTIDGIPALLQSAIWTCGYAGVVQLLASGQTTTDVNGI
jgi:hypothetical protein